MTSRLTLLTIFLFTFNFQNANAQDLDTSRSPVASWTKTPP